MHITFPACILICPKIQGYELFMHIHWYLELGLAFQKQPWFTRKWYRTQSSSSIIPGEHHKRQDKPRTEYCSTWIITKQRAVVWMTDTIANSTCRHVMCSVRCCEQIRVFSIWRYHLSLDLSCKNSEITLSLKSATANTGNVSLIPHPPLNLRELRVCTSCSIFQGKNMSVRKSVALKDCARYTPAGTEGCK